MEQKSSMKKIHQTVIKASPNRETIANAINIIPNLVVED